MIKQCINGDEMPNEKKEKAEIKEGAVVVEAMPTITHAGKSEQLLEDVAKFQAGKVYKINLAYYGYNRAYYAKKPIAKAFPKATVKIVANELYVKL